MSSNDIAIRVENLSKKYKLGLTHAGSLRELTERWFGRWKKSSPSVKPAVMPKTEDEFWALRDISFEVKRGEVLGIIGSNGAGKSTLLKILSQITKPTSGRAEIHGRVGSLLEVGTGFHPELTGRENVFLNGTILGMTRAEVRSRFNDIVDFAGVEQFIDTPVKRYSSGMKVRLGFSVAAHLQPEILIVDEVLAVGDTEFQQRCMGMMKSVATSGRTIFFVSHQMVAIQNLCTRALLIEGGTAVCDGAPSHAIGTYYERSLENSAQVNLAATADDRRGNGLARFHRVETQDVYRQLEAAPDMGDGICISMQIRAFSEIRHGVIGISIFGQSGARIFALNSVDTAEWCVKMTKGEVATVECWVASLNLTPGSYSVAVQMRSHGTSEVIDHVDNATCFEVVPHDVYCTGRLPIADSMVFFRPEWSLTRVAEQIKRPVT